MENLNILVEAVEQVYVGKNSGCRCGCRGKYTNADVDLEKVRSILKRANRMLEKGEARIDDRSSNYVNVTYGNDRAITIYTFDF